MCVVLICSAYMYDLCAILYVVKLVMYESWILGLVSDVQDIHSVI